MGKYDGIVDLMFRSDGYYLPEYDNKWQEERFQKDMQPITNLPIVGLVRPAPVRVAQKDGRKFRD